jgi:hypothetical protein
MKIEYITKGADDAMWWLVVIVCSAILVGFLIKVIQMGLTYAENIERIRHGYPTIEGHVGEEKAAKIEDAENGVFERQQ